MKDILIHAPSLQMKGVMLLSAFLYGGQIQAECLDQNGNGISDLWERLHPGIATASDDDRDGFSNGEEASAGTNPLDPLSFPRIEETETDRPHGKIRLHWYAVAGKSYTVQQWQPATDRWVDDVSQTAQSSSPMTQEMDLGGPSAIYRLRIGDVDQDGDGLNAWEEAMLGYSDTSAMSSGQTGRSDFSAGLRALEGSGTLTLADGSEIPKRPPSKSEVVRFLAQASFGADPQLIDQVVSSGIGGWLDEQLNPATPTMTATYMYNNGPLTSSTFPYFWSRGWWRAAMTGPDQVRLRMGNALSQILVISCAGSDALRQNSYVQADYYDILLTHALGNYRNLLHDVTWSTQMGLYLSHLKNRKSEASIGRYPDENFAREIMQLFSIGLWELNPDGSRKTDNTGSFIPTYDNGTITEMAKVFTGFGFGGPNATSFFSPVNGNDYVYPMKMWDGEHEPGEKHLFHDVVIPAGQNGTEDVADALDAICAHPNVAPFISRLLIQRFTSSNPSPNYLRRVSSVWEDDGSGTRGNLKAVCEAILMDPEARTPASQGDASGKVREPYLRLIALLRAFTARNSRTPATFPVQTYDFPNVLGQQPMWSPTVFNFYLPSHKPAGELRTRDLCAPELEIASADRMINTDNFLQRVIDRGMDPYNTATADIVYCDFSHAQSLSGNAAELVDYLNELLTWGAMSSSTRQAIITAVGAQSTAELKVETAVHLIVESPDFVVLK